MKKKLFFAAKSFLVITQTSLLLSCGGSSDKDGPVKDICAATNSKDDLESCKETVNKFVKKLKISDDTLKKIAKFTKNPAEYEKDRAGHKIDNEIASIVEALLSLRDPAQQTCQNMQKNERLKANINEAICQDSLKKKCDAEEQYKISICARTSTFCDKFFLGDLSSKCKAQTDELFDYLIVTKSMQMCALGEKKKKLAVNVDKNKCVQLLDSGNCDEGDAFTIDSCLKNKVFCDEFYFRKVANTCMTAMEQAFSLKVATAPMKFCELAEKKGKLLPGVDLAKCQEVLSNGRCEDRDYRSAERCLNNKEFCDDFFLGEIGITCFNAISSVVSFKR